MKKIILLSGISASGKSTLAKELLDEDFKNRIIVNRDKIRELLFGYTESNISDYYKRNDLNSTEKLVTKYEDLLINEGLNEGKTIIVDNTHLKLKYIERYFYFNIPLQIRFLDIDLKEAIERDSKRTRTVGGDIIKKQYKDYLNLKSLIKANEEIMYNCSSIQNDLTKDPCIVVDIDGTVADKGERNAYDYLKVENDLPIQSIIDIVNNYKGKVIFCSGREDVCYPQTLSWLQKHITKDFDLLMRKSGDMRPDWQVKVEMWENICKTNYVEYMLDDRCQVVNYARNLGFKVLQTEYGNF